MKLILIRSCLTDLQVSSQQPSISQDEGSLSERFTSIELQYSALPSPPRNPNHESNDRFNALLATRFQPSTGMGVGRSNRALIDTRNSSGRLAGTWRYSTVLVQVKEETWFRRGRRCTGIESGIGSTRYRMDDTEWRDRTFDNFASWSKDSPKFDFFLPTLDWPIHQRQNCLDQSEDR